MIRIDAAAGLYVAIATRERFGCVYSVRELATGSGSESKGRDAISQPRIP